MDQRIRRLIAMNGVALLCLALVTAHVPAQQRDPLQATFWKLGAGRVRTLHLEGFGAIYPVPGAPAPHGRWPRAALKTYEADIDFTRPAMRSLLVHEVVPLLSAQGDGPDPGEQRVLEFVSGSLAWDEFEPTPPSSALDRPGVPALAPGLVRPRMAVARLQTLASFPHGFVKAAREHQATIRRVPHGFEVAFTAWGRRFVGLINERDEVDRVQTWTGDQGLPETVVETIFRDYEDWPVGIRMPRHLTQSRDGHPALDVWLSKVAVNTPVDIVVPGQLHTVAPVVDRADEPPLRAAGRRETRRSR